MSITDLAQIDTLPGMPDALRLAPPKAVEYAALTLDQAITRTHDILDRALAGIAVTRTRSGKPCNRRLEPPDTTLLLFSGGGDSSILAHLLRGRVDGVVHVRTGISIPATWEYVQAVCTEWGLPVRAAYPDDRYEDLVMGRVLARTGKNKGKVVWQGFPGPAAHYLMYQRLKERALERVRREIVQASGRTRGRSGQILFLAGMRWAESDRRFLNAEEFDPWGSVLWVSPLVWWTEGHMAEYRARHLCTDPHQHAAHRLCRPGALPLSEVTEHLHLSGDCLCGAYARPGELGEIALFYPEVAEALHQLQTEACVAGLNRQTWGEGKRKGERAPARVGRLCSGCVPLRGQTDIADDWLERGLITRELHAAMLPVAGRAVA